MGQIVENHTGVFTKTMGFIANIQTHRKPHLINPIYQMYFHHFTSYIPLVFEKKR